MDLVKRVAIIGSGNWGSAIAKIIGENTARYPHFHTTVRMYVHEEEVEGGRKLSEVINETHENVKYLPGHTLPVNIIADPNILTTVADADILIFVLPDAFVLSICEQLKPALKRGSIGVSLIKSFATLPNGEIGLLSNEIQLALGGSNGLREVAVLMGANLAHEVASGQFCETTIGVRSAYSGKILKHLFQTDNFRVTYVRDVFTVEACGAIKNIIGCAAGFVDGLGLGENSKAAVMRIGLAEMIRFCLLTFPKSCTIDTFLESCGVADLIATCYGGRNRRLAEAFVQAGKSISQLETEYLFGQRWEGVLCCQAMAQVLEKRGYADKFPLFMAVNSIFNGELSHTKFIEQVNLDTVN